MTDEQLGQLYHTARNAETFRDFKAVALDIFSASIADTATTSHKVEIDPLAPGYSLIADTAGCNGIAFKTQVSVLGLLPIVPVAAGATIQVLAIGT